MIQRFDTEMVGKRNFVFIDEMVEAQTQKAMTELKKRKTRRGKKRKDKVIGVLCSDKMNVDVLENNSMENRNCENCGIGDKIYKDSRRRGRNSRQTLRPHCSPKAPHNSTQFLMDDHKTSMGVCSSIDSINQEQIQPHKYISPVFHNSPLALCDSFSEDYGLDSLFRDPDVEGFGSTVTFMEHNFEETYRDMRMEELSKMSKTELCNAILEMENKSNELEKALEMSASLGNDGSTKIMDTACSNHSNECQNDPDIKGKSHFSKVLKENERLRIENESLRELLSS